eukprot:5665660-Alexandrium_andersonii.AAC.1
MICVALEARCLSFAKAATAQHSLQLDTDATLENTTSLPPTRTPSRLRPNVRNARPDRAPHKNAVDKACALMCSGLHFATASD